MSTLAFDASGNLTPYEIHKMRLDAFEGYFVTEFPESSTRMPIFEQFRAYSDELQVVIGAGFSIWADGSFITQKLNPRDIDFVIFINGLIYDCHLIQMNHFRQVRLNRVRRLDGYLVPVYPEGHPDYHLNQSNRMQWLYDFGRDWHRRSKGIVQLNF